MEWAQDYSSNQFNRSYPIYPKKFKYSYSIGQDLNNIFVNPIELNWILDVSFDNPIKFNYTYIMLLKTIMYFINNNISYIFSMFPLAFLSYKYISSFRFSQKLKPLYLSCIFFSHILPIINHHFLCAAEDPWVTVHYRAPISCHLLFSLCRLPPIC